MAIDLQALSITSAFNSIISFFRSQENNTGWKDLTTGSEGIFLIRMLANILTNISYKLVTARRENYLSTAQLLSSNIGIAVNLGYSAFRGKNQHREIIVTTDKDSSWTMEKYHVIGTYNDEYDIILANQADIIPNEETQVEVIIGKKKSFTIKPKTSAIKLFTRFEQNISEDFRLLLDNTGSESIELPVTKNMKEMTDGKYLVRTNPYLSVDIMYLNNRTDEIFNNYRYNDNSTITMEYIELADVPTITLSKDMFPEVEFVRTTSIIDYRPFETVPEIKVNAPIDHEVQNLIRSKQDYAKSFRAEVPNVIQSSYIPITPTYTLLSYLKSNYTLVTDAELSKLYTDVLQKENYFGTPLPDVTHPRRYITDLDIKIALANKYIETSRIETDIENILKSNYTILLNQTFNVYDLEVLIEKLSYVKYARVSLRVNDWELGRKTQLGEIINVDGTYYVANSILGKTGPSEPTWNLPRQSEIEADPENYKHIDLTIDYKLNEDGKLKFYETVDNNIVWRAYKRLDVDEIESWTPKTSYKIGDYVYSSNSAYKDFMFKCVDILKYSGTGIPDVSEVEIGDFLVDGNIVWVCKSSDNTYPERIRSHNYRLGDSVSIEDKSFEVISYTGTTSMTEQPIFGKGSYSILEGSISPTTEYKKATVAGDVTNFIHVNDIVKVLTSDKIEYTRSVDAVEYQGDAIGTTIITFNTPLDSSQINEGASYTEILISEQGTYDEDIYWSIINDIDNVKYGWNVYNVFGYSVSIL